MHITLSFRLELSKEDKQKVLSLMKMQSSSVRIAYNMLKEGKSSKDIYHTIKSIFPKLPTRYIDSAIIKASQYPKDKTVVFGGKALFERLCKNHLQGKAREKLKREWKEKRHGTLISVGSKHKTHKGNLCLRFEQGEEGKLRLRITTGNREFVYAEVKREPSNERDKWNTFLVMLLESFKSEKYFPYTVELKLREENIYGNVSFEIPTPEIWLTRKYGVIAIDTNASPLHLAIAEVGDDGNLLSYQSISLHEFLNYPKNTKEHKEWLLAHRIVDIATQKGKAIAIENLKKVSKGFRGDGRAKLRKRLHYWNFKSLLGKIERVAKLRGVEVIKVNPAYTSVIGSLKYSPQLGIDKDIAGAYVIGRRALGFKEEIPENYLKLLSNSEYIEYAIHCYEERERELREQLKEETNKYKRNAIKSELKEIQEAIKILSEKLQSLQSEPRFCEGANGRNPEQRLGKTSQSLWRVLKVAFFFPFLGKVLPRDLSPLKPLLVEGAWERVKSRLVPLEAGGTSQ